MRSESFGFPGAAGHSLAPTCYAYPLTYLGADIYHPAIGSLAYAQILYTLEARSLNYGPATAQSLKSSKR